MRRMSFEHVQRWWSKKYISEAVASNASRKRKRLQPVLISGVMGELPIGLPRLKLGLAVPTPPDFASSILASSG